MDGTTINGNGKAPAPAPALGGAPAPSYPPTNGKGPQRPQDLDELHRYVTDDQPGYIRPSGATTDRGNGLIVSMIEPMNRTMKLIFVIDCATSQEERVSLYDFHA